jgi:hypothetical protein
MANNILIQPAPTLSKPIGANGLASPEWLRWYNQIQIAGGTITSNNDAITAIQARLNTDEANIAASATAITALGNRATADEANISANALAITALQNRATADETNIAANGSAITALQNRATTDEANIASLQNNTLQKANNLSDVQSVAQARTNLGLASVASSGSYTDLSNKPTLPAGAAAVAHEFVTAYNATSGTFTQAQPSFADISGQIATSQVPTLNQNTTGTASNITGICAIANGGTGAASAASALANLIGAWSTWTPTVTASGSMTVSGLTVNQASYQKLGRVVLFALNLTFTLGGTASGYINVTPPVGANFANNVPFAAVAIPAGGSYENVIAVIGSGNFSVFQTGISAWPLGSTTILVSGAYYSSS